MKSIRDGEIKSLSYYLFFSALGSAILQCCPEAFVPRGCLEGREEEPSGMGIGSVSCSKKCTAGNARETETPPKTNIAMENSHLKMVGSSVVVKVPTTAECYPSHRNGCFAVYWQSNLRNSAMHSVMCVFSAALVLSRFCSNISHAKCELI